MASGMEAGVWPQPPWVRRVLRHSERRRRLLHTSGQRRAGSTTRTGAPDLWENLTPIERVGYLTDLLSDRAAQFVARPHRSRSSSACTTRRRTRPGKDLRMRRSVTATHGAGPMTEGGSLKIFARDDEEHGRGDWPRAAGARARTARAQHAGDLHERQRRRALLVQLAVLVPEGLPVGRRHPCAGHRALAGRGPAGPRHRAGGDHDGLDGDDSRRNRHGGGPVHTHSTASRPDADLHRRATLLRPVAVLAHLDSRGGTRGCL